MIKKVIRLKDGKYFYGEDFELSDRQYAQIIKEEDKHGWPIVRGNWKVTIITEKAE